MKFTILTPSYNSQRFIRETIESVINQKGDFSIEFRIVDNCSTDQTRDIVDKYISLIGLGKFPIKCNGVSLEFISGPDSGMYDAIKKGFIEASGDIYAWINSDDKYLPGAFETIQKTFTKYQQVTWLKGITAYIDEESKRISGGKCHLYHQNWIVNGVYGPVIQFIQQDSVFWRAELLELAGGVNTSYSAAGDFALWRQFARYTPLFSLNQYVSCFRRVAGQKSENSRGYWQEIQDYNIIKQKNKLVKRYFSLESKIPGYLRALCFRLLFGRQRYHLISLKDNREPCLRVGEYYNVKQKI